MPAKMAAMLEPESNWKPESLEKHFPAWEHFNGNLDENTSAAAKYPSLHPL